MGLPDLFTTIETHLTAAGAAQTPPIAQIQAGEPDALTNVPVIAYWLLPIKLWEANTLSKTQRTLQIQWMAYFPGTVRGSKTTNLNTELRLASLALAIEARFMGDVDMGGNATGQGLEMSDATPGWADVGPVTARCIGAVVGFYLSNVADISA